MVLAAAAAVAKAAGSASQQVTCFTVNEGYLEGAFSFFFLVNCCFLTALCPDEIVDRYLKESIERRVQFYSQLMRSILLFAFDLYDARFVLESDPHETQIALLVKAGGTVETSTSMANGQGAIASDDTQQMQHVLVWVLQADSVFADALSVCCTDALSGTVFENQQTKSDQNNTESDIGIGRKCYWVGFSSINSFLLNPLAVLLRNVRD